MRHVVDQYLKKFTGFAALLFVAAGLPVAFFWPAALGMLGLAYLISFCFTGSNFLVMRTIDLNDQSRFLKIFGGSIALRFIAVIALIIFVLKSINNHQIFFTVSFIISYICHSVTEIIFLNKILETDTKN